MTADTPHRSATPRIATVGLIAAVSGAMLLTGCGDQTKNSAGSASSASSAPLFSQLPKAIQDAGVIKVGSDISYAPVEYLQNGQAVGLDPDIAAALGKQLGVNFEFQNGKFATLIVGMQSKRFDVIMSAMNDTKQRQDGIDPDTGKKVGNGVDFVDYFTAGTSILVQKGNPKGIKTLDDLCGQTVALEQGTTGEDTANAQAKKCASEGKGKLTVQTYDTDTQALLRLKQGAAAADLNDFPVAAYNAKTSGGGNDFQVTGAQYAAGPYGIAVTKGDAQLRDALKAAVDAIIKNGDYAKILQKWGVTDGALTASKINGGS